MFHCIGLVLAFGLGTSSIYASLTKFQKVITIDQKFNRVKGSHIFSMSDTENNVYQINHSLWYWHWYPTELWTSLKEGETYCIKGYGLRHGFLGLYPNVISAIKSHHPGLRTIPNPHSIQEINL